MQGNSIIEDLDKLFGKPATFRPQVESRKYRKYFCLFIPLKISDESWTEEYCYPQRIHASVGGYSQPSEVVLTSGMTNSLEVLYQSIARHGHIYRGNATKDIAENLFKRLDVDTGLPGEKLEGLAEQFSEKLKGNVGMSSLSIFGGSQEPSPRVIVVIFDGMFKATFS
jgi:hypothetical protein